MGRPHRQQGTGIWAILSDRRVTGVVLVVFIVMAGAGLVLPILPLFARSFGVGYGAVGRVAADYLRDDGEGAAVERDGAEGGLHRVVEDVVAGAHLGDAFDLQRARSARR